MRSWEFKGQSSYQRFPLFSLMSILYLCLYHDIRKKIRFWSVTTKRSYYMYLSGRKSEILELKEKISKIHSGD